MDGNLSREELEAMRSEVFFAGKLSDNSGRHPDLEHDLRQAWFAHHVGIPSEQLARIRGWPVEYAGALAQYLDQENWPIPQ